jgi:SAM-dependent methyltransferase
MSIALYDLGHDEREIERLQLQATIIAGVTRRLIAECRIAPGMRVLDLGCGAGDVSMLLAEAIGPSGSVIAVDREPRAIEAARHRADAAGYRQVDFIIGSDQNLPVSGPFDAVFGRYVLIHQQDPVAFVRHAAAAVRCGGIVAFHELALDVMGHSSPPLQLFERICRCLREASRALRPHYDIATRLVACFEDAGLPAPHLLWESLAGDHASPSLRLLALTYRSMLPHIQRLGLAPADDGDPTTLGDRLAADAAALRAQIVPIPQCCAWARRT